MSLEEEKLGGDYCALGISPWLTKMEYPRSRAAEEVGNINETCLANEEKYETENEGDIQTNAEEHRAGEVTYDESRHCGEEREYNSFDITKSP